MSKWPVSVVGAPSTICKISRKVTAAFPCSASADARPFDVLNSARTEFFKSLESKPNEERSSKVSPPVRSIWGLEACMMDVDSEPGDRGPHGPTSQLN